MIGLRTNQLTMLLVHEDSTISQNLMNLAGLGEDTPVCSDPHNRAQNLGRNCVCGAAVDYRFDPAPIKPVVLCVIPKRVHKHVDVWQNHERPSIMSRRAAELLMSTPGSTPPPSRETGSLIRLRGRGERECANTKRSPCSISEVIVSPRSCAAHFTCRSRFSFKRTVVRIGCKVA